MQFLPFCFRFWILRQTYPWMHIAILGWRVIASGNPRSQQMAEVWFRVYKIDFSKLLAIASFHRSQIATTALDIKQHLRDRRLIASINNLTDCGFLNPGINTMDDGRSHSLQGCLLD